MNGVRGIFWVAALLVGVGANSTAQAAPCRDACGGLTIESFRNAVEVGSSSLVDQVRLPTHDQHWPVIGIKRPDRKSIAHQLFADIIQFGFFIANLVVELCECLG